MKINHNFVFGLGMTAVVVMACHFVFGWTFYGKMGVLKLLLIFFASHPWTFVKYDGYDPKETTVISLWGGFSDGRIYSLMNFFQIAKGDAISILGLGYQGSLCGDAVNIAGISYLRSLRESGQFFGIGYLVAESLAGQIVGVSCLWSGREVYQVFGLVLFSHGIRKTHTTSIVLVDV